MFRFKWIIFIGIFFIFVISDKAIFAEELKGKETEPVKNSLKQWGIGYRYWVSRDVPQGDRLKVNNYL